MGWVASTRTISVLRSTQMRELADDYSGDFHSRSIVAVMQAQSLADAVRGYRAAPGTLLVSLEQLTQEIPY